MTRARGVIAGLTLLAIVTILGTVGYVLIEDEDVFDAFYDTVITISTVGFAEPTGGLSTAGKVLTIFVVIAGVGSALYTATAGLEIALEQLLGGERRHRRLQKEVESMNGHVIVCGFGRVGRNVWSELQRYNEASVVVEVDHERVEGARERGALVVEGNATTDEILREAGIERAKGLIASVRDDSDNLVIVLSAKALRPELLVIARASEAINEEKLLLAGADRVVAPQVVGAHRLAALATQPDLTDFIDLVVQGQVVEFAVEQCSVQEGSALAGQTLRGADVHGRAGALVIALQKPPAEVRLNPDPDEEIEAGSVLIGLGSPAQLASLRRLAEADR
jgi:voltage-gated potassium channel